MLSISFEDDRRVRVSLIADGVTVTVNTDANKLADLLPANILADALDRMQALVTVIDATMPRQLKAVR
jgi:hypothetical protein